MKSSKLLALYLSVFFVLNSSEDVCVWKLTLEQLEQTKVCFSYLLRFDFPNQNVTNVKVAGNVLSDDDGYFYTIAYDKEKFVHKVVVDLVLETINTFNFNLNVVFPALLFQVEQIREPNKQSVFLFLCVAYHPTEVDIPTKLNEVPETNIKSEPDVNFCTKENKLTTKNKKLNINGKEYQVRYFKEEVFERGPNTVFAKIGEYKLPVLLYTKKLYLNEKLKVVSGAESSFSKDSVDFSANFLLRRFRLDFLTVFFGKEKLQLVLGTNIETAQFLQKESALKAFVRDNVLAVIEGSESVVPFEQLDVRIPPACVDYSELNQYLRVAASRVVNDLHHFPPSSPRNKRFVHPLPTVSVVDLQNFDETRMSVYLSESILVQEESIKLNFLCHDFPVSEGKKLLFKSQPEIEKVALKVKKTGLKTIELKLNSDDVDSLLFKLSAKKRNVGNPVQLESKDGTELTKEIALSKESPLEINTNFEEPFDLVVNETSQLFVDVTIAVKRNGNEKPTKFELVLDSRNDVPNQTALFMEKTKLVFGFAFQPLVFCFLVKTTEDKILVHPVLYFSKEPSTGFLSKLARGGTHLGFELKCEKEEEGEGEEENFELKTKLKVYKNESDSPFKLSFKSLTFSIQIKKVFSWELNVETLKKRTTDNKQVAIDKLADLLVTLVTVHTNELSFFATPALAFDSGPKETSLLGKLLRLKNTSRPVVECRLIASLENRFGSTPSDSEFLVLEFVFQVEKKVSVKQKINLTTATELKTNSTFFEGLEGSVREAVNTKNLSLKKCKEALLFLVRLNKHAWKLLDVLTVVPTQPVLEELEREITSAESIEQLAICVNELSRLNQQPLLHNKLLVFSSLGSLLALVSQNPSFDALLKLSSNAPFLNTQLDTEWSTVTALFLFDGKSNAQSLASSRLQITEDITVLCLAEVVFTKEKNFPHRRNVVVETVYSKLGKDDSEEKISENLSVPTIIVHFIEKSKNVVCYLAKEDNSYTQFQPDSLPPLYSLNIFKDNKRLTQLTVDGVSVDFSYLFKVRVSNKFDQTEKTVSLDCSHKDLFAENDMVTVSVVFWAMFEESAVFFKEINVRKFEEKDGLLVGDVVVFFGQEIDRLSFKVKVLFVRSEQIQIKLVGEKGSFANSDKKDALVAVPSNYRASNVPFAFFLALNVLVLLFSVLVFVPIYFFVQTALANHLERERAKAEAEDNLVFLF